MGPAAVAKMPPIQHEITIDQVPSQLVCPITSEVFRDPVVCQDGHTYERVAIERWLASHDTSPMTNGILPSKVLVPNLALRHQIERVWEELSAAAGAVRQVACPPEIRP